MKIKDLNASIRYDQKWAVYASLPLSVESNCRFGQTHFENGGVLDGFICIGTNDVIVDSLLEWADNDYEWLSDKNNLLEAIEQYIEKIKESINNEIFS